MKRKIILSWLLVMALAALVLLGATLGVGTGAVQAPIEPQQIVVQSAQPQLLDPHRVSSEQEIAISRMLWRGLYQLEATSDGSVEAVPAMAAGEPTVNGNVYTITLKPGLKWSDGQPLTASDLEYGIKRECSPEVAGPYQYLLGGTILNIVGCDDYFQGLGPRDAVGVRAVGDTTLEITLVEPKPTFTTIMSLWATFPARQDIIETYGDAWTDPGNIVTNGPFILTGLIPGPGGQAILEPNPNWAVEPKPALRKITIRFIDDLEAAFQAFQTGELDITNVPAAEIPTIQADSNLSEQFLMIGRSRIMAVEMQLEHAVLSNYEVRLALSRAIDRSALVSAVYYDGYLPATYWLVQGLPGFQGNALFENIIGYNPQAARTALADAGYPNGQGFPTLRLTVLDRPDRKADGEFLKNAWNDVLGINVDVEAVDAQTRSQIFNSENFELFMGGWQNDYPDPENSLISLFDTGGANNKYNCSDPDIDAKLAAASTETDNAERIQFLQEAETLIVTKLCGVASVYQTASLYLVNSRIGGVKPNAQLDAAMPGDWCPECWFVTTLRIGSAIVPPGGNATVPLEALDVPSPGLGAFVIDISYDPSVVEPVDCNANPEGDLDMGFCGLSFERDDVNPDTIRLGGFRTSAGATGDLSLADITFQGVGSSGSQSPLVVTIVEFADTSQQPIPATTEDGTITVGVQGDANGNGSVTMVDAMLIAQCVVGLIDCGSIDQTMADVNCSGGVTMVDAMLVAQYVVGLIDEFPRSSCGASLTIGVLLPFTGELADFGPPLQKAASLAIKHINQAGGVLGWPVKIIQADSGSSPAVAVGNASWLIDEGVSAIVGPLASGVTLAVAEGVTVPRGVLQLSSASTSPALSTLEDADLLFRTVLSDAAQGKVLAALAKEKGYGTASTLYLNNAYGQGLSELFASEFQALGGTILATVPHEDWQSTYLPELKTATVGGPDVLAAISYPSQATVYLDEAIGNGLMCEFLFVDGTKYQEMVDELAAQHGLGCLSGMCGTGQGQVESAAGDAFDAAYEAEYGEPPPVPFARETYDAVILIALAAEAAGSTNPLEIRDALRPIANPGGEVVGLGATGIGHAFDLVRLGLDVDYEGTSGAVDFDANGDVTSGAVEVWCIDEFGQIVSVRQEEVVLD